METMKITKELKVLIEKNQNQLKAGIRNHQRLLAILENDPENADVQKQLQTEQEHIIVIGLEQKVILDKLRREYKVFRKQTKINGTKNSIDDKRFNLTIALHRAKKQTISLPPTAHIPPTPYTRPRHRPSPPTPPDDLDTLPTPNTYTHPFARTSPEPQPPTAHRADAHDDEETPYRRPLLPQDVGQVEFLQYLQLATHDVFKEMQSKRVERKRRSTANPQFLYTRGWDISKRKRNFYLSNLTSTAPTTRQSARGKVSKVSGERVIPPSVHGAIVGGIESRSVSPTDVGVSSIGRTMSLPGITHLPSGLTIEPVREEQTICIDCKQPGNLVICDECSHGFHVACHNRPLVATPRHCPVCYTDAKEARLRHQMHAASPITIGPPSVTVQQQQQLIEEKLELKTSLLNRNRQLTAQLTELQDQHSQLTISLRTQQQTREDIMSDQDCTKDKIHKILAFIARIRSGDAKRSEDADLTRENEDVDVKKVDQETADVKSGVDDEGAKGDDDEQSIDSSTLNKFATGNGSRPKVVVIQQNV